MKRSWFGGVLLLVLLVGGVLLSKHMGDFHRELGEAMAKAAVLTGEEARKETDRVKNAWEHRRWLTAMLHDHAPMEDIEENFALLTPLAEEEDFREVCLRLASQLTALGQAQLLTVENLF